MKKNRVCLVSSSGGHLAQLLQIVPALKDSAYFVVTEKNETTISLKEKPKYFLKQQDRKNKYFVFQFLYNIIISLVLIIKERPDVLVTTGAGAVIPLCLFAKLSGSKIVFIGSFAKITTPTITGRIVYKFADRFYIQWEELYQYYPKAIYRGSIY